MSVEETYRAVQLHLEFLGYTVTTDDNERYRASHPDKVNFTFSVVSRGLEFYDMWGSSKYSSENRADFLNFANELNQESRIVKFIIFDHEQENSNLSLIMGKSRFVGNYERGTFGYFITLWEKDWEDFFARSDIRKFLN